MNGEPVYALFVGDKPSKTNTHESVAFIGAKCWPRLQAWVQQLEVNLPLFVNCDSNDFLDYVYYANKHNIPIVALGKKAHDSLAKVYSYVDFKPLEVYALPHPSGLNRKLNDAKYVEKALKDCKKYIKAHN